MTPPSTGLSSVRVVGGLIPSDVLAAVLAGSAPGLSSADYRLGGEAPREAAARAWSHLLGAYRRLQAELARLPPGDPALGVTRERWLLLLLEDLGYGRVAPVGAGGLVLDGKAYPVSHLHGATPLHLLGWGVDLDRRTAGVAGAAHRAPHAMVQEVLNRTQDYLWAGLSNGRLLRLMRDSTTLTGQSFVEFDLQAMFDGELFAEFALLFLLAHQSRVAVPDDGRPTDCWLERWRTLAVSQGVRALALLRQGVQAALETLGTGFLQHPANTGLRERLEPGGDLTVVELHRALLRLAYQLLFWAVAEDREALLVPGAPPAARKRYETYFSSTALRERALRRHGSGHDDHWQAVTLVLDALGRQGEPRLGLPGLGGLFGTGLDPDASEDLRAQVDPLLGCRLSNAPLLSAMRSLSVVQPTGSPRRRVDFRNLGPEELGSIYESLLELVPRHDPVNHRFSLETLSGNDRKTTGSYYTPSELVELVCDTALDPVLDDAEKATDPEQALLAVTVCDPAVGSAHFLVAAARRIATRLAAVRSGEVDPTPTSLAEAMHDVVGRCLYGVDVNPMAADLAKVSLWLTAMSPGRPLSFLDHHIKVGNALLGTTPKLLADGIPDAAYTALTGDDKKVAAAWRKRNATQGADQQLGGGQGDLLADGGLAVGNSAGRQLVAEIAENAAGHDIDQVVRAARRYRTGQSSPELVHARRLADAWCAAFLGPKTIDAVPITRHTLDDLAAGTAATAVRSAVDALAARHRLFHWHLEFPEIFPTPDDGPANTATGSTGGFSAVLGNPPWERIKLQEQEFFAARAPEIAGASNAAARKKAIVALLDTDPALAAEFDDAKRQAEADSLFLRGSGRYPLCGVGDVNTYSVFAEHFRTALAATGRSGIITPTGLATDATTAAFFADTVAAERLAAFYDFENEAKIFGNVHNQFRFAVTSMTGGERVKDVQLAFYTRYLTDVPARRFALAPDEVLSLNPNTGTLPVFRTRRDAEITLSCYAQHPVLIHDAGVNAWGLRFNRMFDMANDSGHFLSAVDLASKGGAYDGWSWQRGDRQSLPLYEAKMLSHWNDRYATYADATGAQLNKGTLPRFTEASLDDPEAEPLARYWVEAATVEEAVPHGWDRDWLLGWRDIARASDVRTFVPSALPKAAVGNKFPLAILAEPRQASLLQAVWSSLIFDYISRQKLSGTGMTYFIVKQLACPTPAAFDTDPGWAGEPLGAWVRRRVFELTYTSHRMRPYAADIVAGLRGSPPDGTPDPGPPFRWLPDRRARLRAELDAVMLHLYGLDRSDAEHVLDSFAVLQKYEQRDHGEHRTKRLVLREYDAMAEAALSGITYCSQLDPAPGDGPRHTTTSTGLR